MGYSFNAGTGLFTDDFNYGQPWAAWPAKFPPLYSPPEFQYSGEEHTNQGILKSTSYARRQFTLQKGTRQTEPTNIDWGVFGGSHPLNPYYLLFPVLQWDQVQMLTMWCYCTEESVMTYVRSFDGYHKDIFYLVINGKAVHAVSNTAGHNWTQDQFHLKRGSNRISWVLATAKDTSYIRNGWQVTGNTHAPRLPRYFRLTDITINHLAYGPHPPQVYNFIAWETSNAFATAELQIRGHANWKGSAALGYQVKWSGTVALAINSSAFLALTGHVVEASAVLIAESEADTAGAVQHMHESWDGGFELGVSGKISVIVSLDAHQGLLIAPLKTVQITPTAPAIINGQPKTVKYLGTQSLVVSTSGTYTSSVPKTPTDPSHALPVVPTYWWVATDLIIPDDDDVISWPEHRSVSNPAWTSNYVYAPTSFGHQRFDQEGLNYVNYSKVVHFWWRYVQHMWINVGSAIASSSTAYTWMFTGMMHPVSNSQHQNVIDNGRPTADYTDTVLDADEVDIFGADSVGTSNHFGIKPDAIQMRSGLGAYVHKQAKIITKPGVYTVIFNGAHSSYHLYARGVNQRIAVNIPLQSNSNFVLGRGYGRVGENYASHMSLMEVGFWNRVLSDAEIKKNSDYLMSTYQFERY